MPSKQELESMPSTNGQKINIMFDPQYYDNRRQELNQDNLKAIIEGYQDIERIVIKTITKARELQAKMQELEAQIKGSQEQNKKKDGKKEIAEPAKTGK
jgi:hypothetical protein